MKYGGRVMLAVAGGYVLGRTKKMKLAIMLAGMASGNKIASDPTLLLQRGTRLVQSNPQLNALSDQVRGRLVEAGKGIAVAVVSKQMESLSDRLGERTDRLSGRLDERTGLLRVARSGRVADETDLADEDHADDWVDNRADDWADEDRAEVDEDRAEQGRAARRVGQPRPRRTTVRHRTAGGSQRGGRNV